MTKGICLHPLVMTIPPAAFSRKVSCEKGQIFEERFSKLQRCSNKLLRCSKLETADHYLEGDTIIVHFQYELVRENNGQMLT